MDDIFDSDMALPIPCPECGHEIERSIQEMERKPHMNCPTCSEAVTIDLDDLQQTLDDMADEWIDFADDID